MKSRTPRIPLPELTEEEKGRIAERRGGWRSGRRQRRPAATKVACVPSYMPIASDRGVGGAPIRAKGSSSSPETRRSPLVKTGNSLKRPEGHRGGGMGRNSDPAMTLDYPFKTDLFWIVSRANNCQYCLGHQEMKLAVAGRTEEQIAGLDGDWSEYTPAQRAAYAFARKLTAAPHELCDADIDALRVHYKDIQILEIILSIAGNNSINRWKRRRGRPPIEGTGQFRQPRPTTHRPLIACCPRRASGPRPPERVQGEGSRRPPSSRSTSRASPPRRPSASVAAAPGVSRRGPEARWRPAKNRKSLVCRWSTTRRPSRGRLRGVSRRPPCQELGAAW